jgi:hypothetical protein
MANRILAFIFPSSVQFFPARPILPLAGDPAFGIGEVAEKPDVHAAIDCTVSANVICSGLRSELAST